MGDYIFQHIETEEDLEQELELIRLVFTGECVDAMIKRLLVKHPYISLSNFFTVKHDGRIVATLNLIPQTWSIGGVLLKVAEMGMVATHPEHRMKGVQRLLNAEYDKHITKEGFDLSVIEGIPYFYRQFGYEYTIPLDSEVKMSINCIPDHRQLLEIRPFTNSDLSRAMEFLKKSQEKFLVHSVRSEKIWRMQHETGWQADWPFEAYVVERNDKMVGYFRLSRKESKLFLIEISETDRSIAKSILSFIKSKGKDEGISDFISRVSHDEPFTDYMMEVGAEKNSPYAWQVKVVDHVILFRKLASLLEERLKASHPGLTHEINMNFYRFGIRIRLEEGRLVEISRISGSRRGDINFNPIVFPKLILGVKNGQELQNIYADVNISTNNRSYINAMFPKGISFINPCY